MRFALPTTTTLKIFFEIFSLQVDALQTSASDATNEKKKKLREKEKTPGSEKSKSGGTIFNKRGAAKFWSQH